MKARRLAVVPKDKQTLDDKCKEWLTRAEKIKETKNWQPAAAAAAPEGVDSMSSLSRSLPPISTRKLATREEIILLESAKLNGFIFPPWTSPPKLEEFQPSDGETLFLDEPDLHLSSLQQDIFAGWKRPHELLSMGVEDVDHAPTPAISISEKTDLVQDVLTDCSVVASLCATTSRLERGLEKVW